MKNIQMVDLKGQHSKIEGEISEAVQNVIHSSLFINGPEVKKFANALKSYLNVAHVIPCGNGTDALQLALLALNLEPEAEVIIPSFNYVASAEAVAFLGYKPVFIDSDLNSFNLKVDSFEKSITKRTRAIIAVHLFGQCCNMEAILCLAKKYNLFVIEDAAPSLGAKYNFSDGTSKFAGTIGDIGMTSFFPSKNLGCMGDGGALFTNDQALAEKVQMLANHGQKEKYTYEMVGVNSRLDTMQAAILLVKLKYLDQYNLARQKAAAYYTKNLAECSAIKTPLELSYSTHIYHQYTIQVDGDRDELKAFLQSKGIPTMVYYPSALHVQKAYAYLGYKENSLPDAESLCKSVLSLPMHTELDDEQLAFICENLLVGLVNYK